ncbi:DUF7359 domain-containing protein [Bacillus mojavensis]|uniref:DUF7359 domain-containing protein n=1 Tax=Bacillus mojavensis TaxID=72360 RepID=UPI002DBF4273|nr:phage tail protein [Bacillus mojavensis]MEC1685928.1 phage tail protein [Bacillus mojavensis]
MLNKNKPGEILLSLAKPNKKKIANIADFSNVSLNLSFADLNDLSFNIPLKARYNFLMKPNHVAKLMREWYLIKAEFLNRVEWFVITGLTKSENEEQTIQVRCQGLPYILHKNKIRSYQGVSKNLQEVATDCLKGTRLNIGYIDPSFNEKRRSFDITSTRYEFLKTIWETFEAVPVFDTVKNTVSFYKKETVSKYKGVQFSPERFMIDMEDTIDIDEVVTRLNITGKDGIVINSVNPTGQSYLDDFSYFLYPFKRDENRNVIKHSDYMDDDLCHAILDYNELVNKEGSSFHLLLNQKRDLETQKTTQENKLFTLENIELQQILDKITVAKKAGDDTKDLIKQRDAKLLEVTAKKAEISRINSQITNISQEIEKLKNRLSMDKFLGEELKKQLSYFIFEDDWANDNIFDETELYEKGLEELSNRNAPPVDIRTNIVNLFNVNSEKAFWDRIYLGDIIRVVNKNFRTDVKATLSGMTFDFDQQSIQVTLSNGKRARSLEQEFANTLYTAKKASTEFNKKKIDYDTLLVNYNARNDRISSPVANPTILNNGTAITHVVNDNGSVDISIEWQFPNSKEDKYNIDGFLVHCYSDTSSDTYIFGSKMSFEQYLSVSYDKRIATLTGQVSNKYYTFGIQAYRTVEASIDSSGRILSDIIQPLFPSENPYLPSNSVEVKGSLSGKVNGLYTISTETKPEDPETGTIWINPQNNKQELFNGEEWIVSSAGSADSLNGFTASTTTSPNSIPVRNELGIISGSIDGNAELLGGRAASDYALAENIPVPPKFAKGTYTGDGTLSKQIPLAFTPDLVKITPISPEDSQLVIESQLGGYTYQVTSTGLSLIGGDLSYGALGNNLFITGSDSNCRGNKLNVKYIWEAYQQN